MSNKSPLTFCCAALLGVWAAHWLLSGASVSESSVVYGGDKTTPLSTQSTSRRLSTRFQQDGESVGPAQNNERPPITMLLDLLEEDALGVLEKPGQGMGVLWVEVMDQNGEPAQDVSLMVQGCGGKEEGSKSSSGTSFFNLGSRPFHAAMPVGVCSVRAGRVDGLLSVESPLQDVEIVDGEISSVVLTVPGEKAGIGILLGEALGGIEVAGIFADSPAWDSSLEVGDVIVSVNGESTEEMSPEIFAELGTGRPGSMVSLLVQREDPELGVLYQGLSLTREFLAEDLELAEHGFLQAD